MADIITKRFLATCDTELPADVSVEAADFESESWFQLHLAECNECQLDTRDGLRQQIKRLELMAVNRTRTINNQNRLITQQYNLLMSARKLLTDAIAQSQEWGMERAKWMDQCSETLDLTPLPR